MFETYLLEIISKSKLFDEVIPEQKYRIKKLEQRTADVMVRKADTYIFLDSKSFSPKRDLRIFSEEAFRSEIDRLAKTCKQIYLHTYVKFPQEYNFFDYKKPVDSDKVFGLVILKENPHIRAEIIYRRAAELIGIGADSVEFEWLCKHIGIVSIYDIEVYCFTSSDIVAAVNKNRISGKINDYWFSGVSLNDELTNSDVKRFKDNLGEAANILAAELLNPKKS